MRVDERAVSFAGPEVRAGGLATLVGGGLLALRSAATAQDGGPIALERSWWLGIFSL